MKTLLWIAAAVMVVAAAMLVADVGAAALWIAVIAVGIAVVVVVKLARTTDCTRSVPKHTQRRTTDLLVRGSRATRSR